MIWTAATPIYLPLMFPDSVLAAAHRLADDVERVLGARPPLRHQPAPFGRPQILIAPDPAYTAVVAPAEPQTFAVLTVRDELTVSGAEPFGTVLSLAWLAQAVLGLDPLGDWQGRQPAPRERIEVELSHEQPRWPTRRRAWALAADELAGWPERRVWVLAEALLRCGGNRLETAGGEDPRVAEVCDVLGLETGRADEMTVSAESLDRGDVPRWW